jgi:alkylation response protein AidB-like acyl-CoA dehydrogenase
MVTAAPERQELVAAVGEFARREIAPRVQAYDEAEELPVDLLERMSELGFFGGVVAPEWGGLGLDFETFAAMIEEVSKACHAVGTLLSMPSGLTGAALERFGTPEQKERWLRPLAEGRIFGAAGVTEPQSGSDVAAMQTTYRREGDEYVISGAKAWISNLKIASYVLTFATRAS